MKKISNYFELKDDSSSKFWEISLLNNSVNTRHGKIKDQGNELGKVTRKQFDDAAKAQKEYDKQVKEKTGKGYQEVPLPNDSLRPQDYILITEKEATERFQLDSRFNSLYGDEDLYMLYEGDLYVDALLETDKFCAMGKDTARGFIVTGNLTVKSVFFQPEIDSGENTLVLGDLIAKSINLSGGEVYVKGNVTAEQTLCGYYNHGSCIIEGDAKAVVIFPDDYYFTFKGTVSGIVISEQEIEGVEEYTDTSALIPELIHEEGYVDSGKVSKRVNAEQHIIKEELLPWNIQPAAPRVPRAIASARPEWLTLEQLRLRIDSHAIEPVGDFDKVLYYDGDLYIFGNLDKDWVNQVAAENGQSGDAAKLLIVVKGNCIVDGDLAPVAGLLVLGNIECDTLLSNNEWIYVAGDAAVKYVLAGNGHLTVKGITTVPYIINSNHAAFITPKDAIVINDFDNNNDALEYDYTVMDLERIGAKAAYTEGRFNKDKFIGLAKAGKSPLRKGGEPARLWLPKVLKQRNINLEAVEELDLSHAHLDKFPLVLTRLPKLKKLILDNNPIGMLPREIGNMKNLEELHVHDCSIEYIPEEISGMEHLKLLRISGNPIKQIPAGFGKLAHLQELDLNKSLSYLNSLPDLSGLRNLKIVKAGNQFDISSAPARQELLSAFFTIPLLEFLDISSFGVYESEDEAGNKTLLRGELTNAHLKGLSGLKQLTMLVLGNCALKSIPEELYLLTQLKTLYISVNQFSLSKALKLVKHLPGCDIDFRNPISDVASADDTAEAKAWRKMDALWNKAIELWGSGEEDKEKVLAAFDKTLALFETGKVVDKYSMLRIHYMRSLVCGEWNDVLENDTKTPRATFEKSLLMAIEQHKKTLSLVPAHFFMETSMGTFYVEFLCTAGNALAWNTCRLYDEADKLEEGLKAIAYVLQYPLQESQYYIYDTQVRILLKQGKKETAWQVVKKTLELDESFSHFDDITKEKEYKAWLKKQSK